MFSYWIIELDDRERLSYRIVLVLRLAQEKNRFLLYSSGYTSTLEIVFYNPHNNIIQIIP